MLPMLNLTPKLCSRREIHQFIWNFLRSTFCLLLVITFYLHMYLHGLIYIATSRVRLGKLYVYWNKWRKNFQKFSSSFWNWQSVIVRVYTKPRKTSTLFTHTLFHMAYYTYPHGITLWNTLCQSEGCYKYLSFFLK